MHQIARSEACHPSLQFSPFPLRTCLSIVRLFTPYGVLPLLVCQHAIPYTIRHFHFAPPVEAVCSYRNAREKGGGVVFYSGMPCRWGSSQGCAWRSADLPGGCNVCCDFSTAFLATYERAHTCAWRVPKYASHSIAGRCGNVLVDKKD